MVLNQMLTKVKCNAGVKWTKRRVKIDPPGIKRRLQCRRHTGEGTKQIMENEENRNTRRAALYSPKQSGLPKGFPKGYWLRRRGRDKGKGA